MIMKTVVTIDGGDLGPLNVIAWGEVRPPAVGSSLLYATLDRAFVQIGSITVEMPVTKLSSVVKTQIEIKLRDKFEREWTA